jgi:hypothetical protein
MLIAHGLADLVRVSHTGSGLTRWFEVAFGVPKYSFPDKMFGKYLEGSLPSPQRLNQIQAFCPEVKHWIRHPLYFALNTDWVSPDGWEAFIFTEDGGEIPYGETTLFFKYLPKFWNVDVDLAFLLMLIRSADGRQERLRRECFWYLPTLFAVACHLTSVGYVKYILFDLICEILELELPESLEREGGGWPKTYAELDTLIAAWAAWIDTARLVGLVSSNQSAAKFSRLVQKLGDEERKRFINTLSLAADEHLSKFHFPILRRFYHAMRRHPPFLLNVGYPPNLSLLVSWAAAGEESPVLGKVKFS